MHDQVKEVWTCDVKKKKKCNTSLMGKLQTMREMVIEAEKDRNYGRAVTYEYSEGGLFVINVQPQGKRSGTRN